MPSSYRVRFLRTFFLGIENTAERSDGSIGAVEVDRNDGIFDEWVAKQQSKDVKHIVTIISEGKRMNGSIEMNDGKH